MKRDEDGTPLLDVRVPRFPYARVILALWMLPPLFGAGEWVGEWLVAS